MECGFVTRVIQALAGGPQGGAELHFVRMALALQRTGLDQRVVMRPHPALVRPLRDAGILVAPAPFGGRFDFRTRPILRREIAVFGPDTKRASPNRWLSSAISRFLTRFLLSRPE